MKLGNTAVKSWTCEGPYFERNCPPQGAIINKTLKKEGKQLFFK